MHKRPMLLKSPDAVPKGYAGEGAKLDSLGEARTLRVTYDVAS